jgi:hypothetical protein
MHYLRNPQVIRITTYSVEHDSAFLHVSKLNLKWVRGTQGHCQQKYQGWDYSSPVFIGKSSKEDFRHGGI